MTSVCIHVEYTESYFCWFCAGGNICSSRKLHQLLRLKTGVLLHIGQRRIISSRDPFCLKLNKDFSLWSTANGFQRANAMSIPFRHEVSPSESDEQRVFAPSNKCTDVGDGAPPGPQTFKNRFLNLMRFGSLIDDAAELFFKSEIRRRLFVTAALLTLSRVGYFIPLPGFDRQLIPNGYLSFASRSSGMFTDYRSTVILLHLQFDL